MSEWELFRKESVASMLTPGARVIDIGGGLRAVKGRGNRYDPEMGSYFAETLSRVQYQIVDPVSDFAPDIIGDIHNLPLADDSVDGVICIAVLEHVEDPIKAVSELRRILKPGGKLFLYVPFLYYYHAEHNYYQDYWRYTKDSLPLLARGFSVSNWVPVRGAFETWIHLSPLGRSVLLQQIARLIDRVSGKTNSNQVSGYYGLLAK